jgi:NitT/TauT family transport system substrate-binding protein
MGWAVLLLVGCILALAPSAQAAEKIATGIVGAAVAPAWPFLIAADNGLFAAAGVEPDIIFGPTAPGILQELAAGSLDIAVTGAAEPIHAFDKGAPVAIIRVIGQSAPYEMMAKPGIHRLAELKGKTIEIGGPADITAVYFDRMMRAAGLGKGDYDLIFGGSTGARMAALKAGAADATLLIPPVNFRAKEAGFSSIALAIDYARDLIFSTVAANRSWAANHQQAALGLVSALTQAVAWFDNAANREAAIAILVKDAHSSPADAAASYDFFRRIDFFEPTGKISRARLQNLIEVQRSLGDVANPLTADRLVAPGVTALSD